MASSYASNVSPITPVSEIVISLGALKNPEEIRTSLPRSVIISSTSFPSLKGIVCNVDGIVRDIRDIGDL